MGKKKRQNTWSHSLLRIQAVLTSKLISNVSTGSILSSILKICSTRRGVSCLNSWCQGLSGFFKDHL